MTNKEPLKITFIDKEAHKILKKKSKETGMKMVPLLSKIVKDSNQSKK